MAELGLYAAFLEQRVQARPRKARYAACVVDITVGA
jgi:hypothetical protein